ncbi:MAG: LysR family transcriptional regulator [Marinomonas sp.]
MNLKQLRAFKEIMVTGSVSKAASNLFRTQPAVSSQLASLEEEVGMPLFERREGRLHPVPEAEYILAEATEILEKVENLQDSLTRVKNLNVGRINMVAMISPSIFFLPQLISRFVQNKEHVDVSLFSHSSFQAQQLMSAQRYDVGLVDHVESVAPSLIHHDPLDFKCVCAVPASDPLAQNTTICAQDLDNKPLAMLDGSHAIHKQLESIFKTNDLTLNKRFETQYFLPQLSFVENGLACAIVDPITVASYQANSRNQDQIVFLPFTSHVTFSISIVTPAHRPLSTLAMMFVKYLKSELQTLQ